MSDTAKKRASRLRKFKDYDDEYRETGSKEAAIRRDEGMREGTERDFVHVREELLGRTVDDYKRREALRRKLGMEFAPKER